MKNQSAWTQMDSDIIAHFLQVHGQIAKSRWCKSGVQYTTRGGKLIDHDFPDPEATVYAAVYFRQLFAKRDLLLKDATGRFLSFADCPIRGVWIKHEQEHFTSFLDSPAFQLNDCTVRQLFEAYMYGAGLLHKTPNINCEKRKRFLRLYDTEPPAKLLYALNVSMRELLNPVAKIAAIIYRDFPHWLNAYSLPLPDIRWHDRLFDASRGRPSSTGA